MINLVYEGAWEQPHGTCRSDGYYIQLPCCDGDAVPLYELIETDACPTCGQDYDVEVSSVDSTDEETRKARAVQRLLAKNTPCTEYAPNIDADVDRGIVDLVQTLNASGLPTLYSCSGLFADHYDCDGLRDELDEAYVMNQVFPPEWYVLRPNIELEAVFHTVDEGRLRVDDEFQTFVNECVYPANWSIQLKGTYSPSDVDPPKSPQYSLLLQDHIRHEAQSFDEYDAAVREAIDELGTRIEDTFGASS